MVNDVNDERESGGRAIIAVGTTDCSQCGRVARTRVYVDQDASCIKPLFQRDVKGYYECLTDGTHTGRLSELEAVVIAIRELAFSEAVAERVAAYEHIANANLHQPR